MLKKYFLIIFGDIWYIIELDWTNMWVSTIFKDKYVIIDFGGINT